MLSAREVSTQENIYVATGFSGVDIDGRMQWVDFVCPEALEILNGQGFDLILMDVQMPELGGLSISRLIRHCERGSLAGSTDERD